MVRIKLENSNLIAIIDDVDFEKVSNLNWRLHKGRYTHYAVAWNGSKLVLMHRLVLGITERSLIADHINGDGLDNRRKNLRACSHLENNSNKRVYKNSRTGIKGVCPSGNKWFARITKNGKIFCLGTFETKEAAAAAYNEAAKKLHGEFASLNQQA